MGTDGLYGMTVHRPRQTDVKRRRGRREERNCVRSLDVVLTLAADFSDPSHNVESL
jgi:hypothetical protein